MALELGDYDAYQDPMMAVQLRGADGVLRRYEVPSVSAAVGLWCRRVLARRDLLETTDLAEAGEAIRVDQGDPPIPDGMSVEEAMLGAAELVAQLAADGVPDAAVQHLIMTQYARVLGGDDGARRYWTTNPNAPSPSPAPSNRAERRAAKKISRKVSDSPGTDTAEAGTIPSPGSGSGTSTRKPPAARAMPRKSRGSRS